MVEKIRGFSFVLYQYNFSNLFSKYFIFQHIFVPSDWINGPYSYLKLELYWKQNLSSYEVDYVMKVGGNKTQASCPLTYHMYKNKLHTSLFKKVATAVCWWIR